MLSVIFKCTVFAQGWRCAAVLCSGLLAGGVIAGDIYIRMPDGGTTELSNLAPDQDGFSLLIRDPDSRVFPGEQSVLPASSPGLVPLSAALRARAVQYAPLIREVALQYGLDARLLHALIAVESGYNAEAVSPKGAMGMMQLMPTTARRFGVIDRRNVRQNVDAGARYLAELLRMFENDLRLALAAYNAGENAVVRHGRKVPPFAETITYVPRVLDFYARLSAVAELADARMPWG